MIETTLQLPADAPIKKMLFHLSLDSQENCSKMEELNYRIDKLKCLEFSENAEFFFDYFSATYFYFYIVKLISGQIFILNYIGNSNIRNTYSSSFGLCTGALPKVLTNLLFTKIRYGHGLRTPNEGINQRYLKNWANVVDKICFASTP